MGRRVTWPIMTAHGLVSVACEPSEADDDRRRRADPSADPGGWGGLGMVGRPGSLGSGIPRSAVRAAPVALIALPPQAIGFEREALPRTLSVGLWRGALGRHVSGPLSSVVRNIPRPVPCWPAWFPVLSTPSRRASRAAYAVVICRFPRPRRVAAGILPVSLDLGVARHFTASSSKASPPLLRRRRSPGAGGSGLDQQLLDR